MLYSWKWKYYGGIAQLGERLHGMQEAVGSSPIISTFKNILSLGRMFFCCGKQEDLVKIREDRILQGERKKDTIIPNREI